MTVTDSQIAEFHSALTDYGYLDVEYAIEKFQEIGMTAMHLADEVREYQESTGTDMSKIDVCYVAYDYILQMARNKLDEIIHFDICNDIKGGTAFYTYGNAVCTSFDYSEEATDQLTEKIQKASPEQLEELLDDNCVKVFLYDVNIDIKEIQKVEVAN